MASGPLKTSNAIWMLVGVLAIGGVAFVLMWSAASADVDEGGEEQRIASVQRIASTQPPGARAALARTARSDKSPRVRRTALISLGQIRTDQDREVFQESTRDEDDTIRAVAADTLGTYNDAEAVTALLQLVKDDPSERVRIGALRGLARCEDPRAVVCLVQTAEFARSLEIKRQAMRSLMRKFSANIRKMRNPADVPRWRDLIQRWKWDQRIRDAYAAAGADLVDRPEHILGKDYHPERHKY